MSLPHVIGFVAALGLIQAVAVPQRPSPERGLEFVAVDFAAIAPDGGAVADLTAGEVSVRIGGRTRAVRSLQRIVVAPGAAAAAGAEPLPAPFGTNAVSESGRTLLLIVDDDSFRIGREVPLREAVDALLPRLSPRDRISLVTMPYGGVKVPLTTDHTRITTALRSVIGQAPQRETGSELACRTRRTLESLAGYLYSQHGIRETPLTVLFITGGLAAPRRDAPMTMAPGMCELRQDAFEEVAAAAGRSRAHFYVIQPGDLMSTPRAQPVETIAGGNYRGSDNPIEGIEHLAGVTNGVMLPLTNAVDGAFGRVLRETASHYQAAVEAEPSDRSGRVQQLELKVSRPGVQLRSRRHIAFAAPDPRPGRAVNPAPRDMLTVASVFRDLPLRTSGYAALEPDGRTLRLVTLTEPIETGVKLASLMAALYDRDGKLVSHWTATSEELQDSPVVGAMPVVPGAYRLRAAAIDSTGRAGTADHELEADVVRSGELTLSSLVLGLSRDKQFSPRLQFSDEPVAIGYVEIYGPKPGARISAALELATTLNGPALTAVPLLIESPGKDRYIATGAVPIETVPPGDYIVRALIGMEGHAITRVVRTLRKVPQR